MNRSNNWIKVIIVLVFLILAVYFFYHNKSLITKELPPVGIDNYQGEKLSSVYDFRENSIKGVQYIDISNYTLEISGLVKKPQIYTYEEILKKQNYEKVVTLHCVEGWDATILWKGVLVRDLINDASPEENAKEVIFYASDGYTTAFPLDYFYNNNIIMAFEMNNATIIPERGFPFQLVAEDKWGYKWIKWITKIELSENTDYEGYWESRGYSKEGNLNESFIG